MQCGLYGRVKLARNLLEVCFCVRLEPGLKCLCVISCFSLFCFKSDQMPSTGVRPPLPSLEGLMDLVLANEALQSVGITPHERDALLFAPHTHFARDLHALDSAVVVLLMEVSRPDSEAVMLSSGPYVYHEDSCKLRAKRVRWLASAVCQQMCQRVYDHEVPKLLLVWSPKTPPGSAEKMVWHQGLTTNSFVLSCHQCCCLPAALL